MKTRFKGLLSVLAACLLLGGTGNYTALAETVEESFEFNQSEVYGPTKIEIEIRGAVEGIMESLVEDASKPYIPVEKLVYPELTSWINSNGEDNRLTKFVGKNGEPYGYNERGLDYLNDEFTWYIYVDGEVYKEITTGLSVNPKGVEDGLVSADDLYGFNLENVIFGPEIAGKTVQVVMQEKI